MKINITVEDSGHVLNERTYDIGLFLLQDDDEVGRKIKEIIETAKKSQEEQIPF
jgi:hypothetical protein